MLSLKHKRVKKRHSTAVRVFSDRLKSLRRKRGLSQLQLAVKSNIHLSYLGRLERGESSPSLDTIIQFAYALGIAPADLISTESTTETTITALRGQVRSNVVAVIDLADPVLLQTLAVVFGILGNAIALSCGTNWQCAVSCRFIRQRSLEKGYNCNTFEMRKMPTIEDFKKARDLLNDETCSAYTDMQALFQGKRSTHQIDFQRFEEFT